MQNRLAATRYEYLGVDAVRPVYDAVVGSIRLRARFEGARIRFVVAERAFARTNSAWTIAVVAIGARNAEAHREPSMLHNAGNESQIARDRFATGSVSR